jgi:phosphoesterase RecJ-like protein
MADLLADAAGRLRAARSVLVACHAAPDGDAAGSMLATAAIARRLGKQVGAYCHDPLPAHLRFLPGAADVVSRLPVGARFDLTLVHDCGDRRLLGEGFPSREVTGPLVVIDHHASAVPFGDLDLRDPTAAASGVLVARLAHALGLGLDRDTAIGVFCALQADTGGFRYANTDAESLRLASECVDAGVRPYEVCRPLFEERPRERFALYGVVASTFEVDSSGRIASAVCTRAMQAPFGREPALLDGVVNELRALRGVEVGFLVTEDAQGNARVSLRGKGALDLGELAQSMGGGGHRSAAGLAMALPPLEARRALVTRLQVLMGVAPGQPE